MCYPVAMEMNGFGKTLTKCREREGMSIKELAQASGLSARAIQKIEGGALPSLRTIKKLAEALNVSVASFFV